jgi:hypothetical protein
VTISHLQRSTIIQGLRCFMVLTGMMKSRCVSTKLICHRLELLN